METTQKTKELLNKLINKAVEYNSEDFSVFLDLSGHVNWLNLDIHYGGWSTNINKTSLGCINLDKDHINEKLQEAIDNLDEAYRENSNRLVYDLEYTKNAELARLEELKAKYEGETVSGE